MKKIIAATLSLLLILLNLSAIARAGEGDPQAAIELRGTIIDESNAYIPAAPLTLDDGKGNKYTAQTDERGRYHVVVKPGVYMLTVEVEGFAKYAQQIDLTQKRKDAFDIKLNVIITEQLEVKDNSTSISTEPDKNLSAITLTEKDLEALPDDPDELLQTLKEMAGAAGGGDDAAIYVGGFRERGQIPPKEAILRISINQNPFAAEYQEPGAARIEIITKPGADTYHGGFRMNFNDESLNARNAFFPNKPAYQLRNFGANFSGPIIHNRWGFFFDMEKRDTDESDLVNATVLNPLTGQPEPFIQSVLTPARLTNFSLRTDYLATKKHTFGFQYRYNKNEAINQGLNGFDLPERAFNRTAREDTLRFSFTTIASEHAVNEMRLQLSRRTFDSQAITSTPAILVLDTFNAGGNQGSLFMDNSNRNLDITDNITYTYKTHTFKAGFRAEGLQFTNINRSNFGGTFTFGTEDGTPLELYRRVLAGDPTAHPSQFTINRGDPFVGFSQWQMGSFIQDDWKVSARLMLSFGLRHEFQTHLRDKMNFAPRFGLAWNPDKARKTTLRAGAGIFYTGLDNGITSNTIQLDGFHQQQFIITQPDFFATIPDNLAGAITRPPTIRIKAEGLNDPYSFISTVSYERPLPLKLFGSLGYTFTRGVHLLRSRNINAPILDQNGLPSVFPFPGEGPILEYESTGLSRRHEMRINLRTGFSQKFTLFANYTLASTKSDTDSAGMTPANPYDFSTEYGRAGNDVRHNLFIGGSYLAPWGVRVSPLIFASSGRPFNILSGIDLNGDTSFADRPSFALAGAPGAIVTPYGIFNPRPLPGEQIIPRNYGDGPGMVSVNLNLSKTFGFGPPPNNFNRMAAQPNNQQQGDQQNQNQRGNRGNNNTRGGNNNRGSAPAGGGGFGGGGPMMMQRGGGGGGPMGGGMGGMFGDNRHKYNITVGLNVQNVLNHTNLSGFSGTLTSPFFGIANRALQSRRIEAQVRFNF
jgi:hypothetical protein